MPKIWVVGKHFGDENHYDSSRSITIEELKATTGVEWFQVNVEDIQNANEYWQLRKDRGYDYEDLVEISEDIMGKEKYDALMKVFDKEHIHDFEEIRLFLEGSGYFDVRNKDDLWVRIHASKNDLLILPGGIYHKFKPDEKKYAKVARLFCGTPVWVAKFRPEADSEPARQNYLKNLLQQGA